MRKALLTSVIAGAALALTVPYTASAQQGWGGQQQPGQWGGQQQFGQQQQPGQQQFGQRGFGQQQFARRQLEGEGAPLYVSPSEVLQVQQRLSQLGFNPGQIDGRWGEQTATALENFQQQAGLSPTGNLNLTTLSALGVQLGQDGQFLGIGQQPQGMQQPSMRQQPGMQQQQGGFGQRQAGGGQQNGFQAQQQENGNSN